MFSLRTSNHTVLCLVQMLQEELRRYRQRLGEQEGTIATQDRTITALRVRPAPAGLLGWPVWSLAVSILCGLEQEADVSMQGNAGLLA